MTELIVAVIVAVLGSQTVGIVVQHVLSNSDRNNPMRQAIRILLFLKLELFFKQMVDHNGIMSIEDKRTAEDVYTAYHDLGGNGVGTEMIQQIREAHIKGDDYGA